MLRRPLSLVCSILIVVAVLMIVVLVVAPELGKTFLSVGKEIEKKC